MPDDGLPCIDDFIATFESMLLGGVELGREPIDCTMPAGGGLSSDVPICQHMFDVTVPCRTYIHLCYT